MTQPELRETAAALVRPGTGILAADESVATCSGRLEALGIDSSEPSRRAYRHLLISAPGIEDHISGVILFDETIRQSTDESVAFPDLLTERGILPGIKVDTGAKPMAGAPGETVTEGLDGLRERIAEYYELGARFAKWRAVVNIGDGLPTRRAVVANAHALARYAALCHEGGLVPIVEPEVLMKGDHDIDRCYEVTGDVLTEVFSQLRLAEVDLASIVLKPSMVVPGADASDVPVSEVATRTVECLRETVPAAVAGVAFLSGGQSPSVATEHLAAMVGLGPHPWPLTFSYGRAIQDDVLSTWAGDDANADSARAVLLERAQANGDAALGKVPTAA
ncbi:MAG: class I fructose-bisphosphate aldolase [Acidimicrobiales bacterium]